jgi:predicted NBD/HSP70 family sugar kinase
MRSGKAMVGAVDIGETKIAVGIVDNSGRVIAMRDMMMVLSRLAKLISQASVISLPLPVARPRMRAIETIGARGRRTRKSG